MAEEHCSPHVSYEVGFKEGKKGEWQRQRDTDTDTGRSQGLDSSFKWTPPRGLLPSIRPAFQFLPGPNSPFNYMSVSTWLHWLMSAPSQASPVSDMTHPLEPAKAFSTGAFGGHFTSKPWNSACKHSLLSLIALSVFLSAKMLGSVSVIKFPLIFFF